MDIDVIVWYTQNSQRVKRYTNARYQVSPEGVLTIYGTADVNILAAFAPRGWVYLEVNE